MPYVTGTVTIEIAPIGGKFELRMWIGKESVRVSKFTYDTIPEARVSARHTKNQLKLAISADVIVVEQDPPLAPPGHQPDMFPIKR